MSDVYLTLLGEFAAAVDGVSVPERAWRLRKARELVKLMALAPGHRLNREVAMDVLWRDRPPDAAANNLNQAVHVARRALGADAIEVRDGLLALGSHVGVDVDRLQRAAAEARRAGTLGAYRAAVYLYRGELLPENRYDDWAAVRRDELAELASELEEAVAARRSDGPDRPPALPVDASSFVGRSREVSELTALLRTTRLLTLVGTGGVGKTRLALELARGAEASYPGGAALVELAALSDGRLVPDAVAAALDVRALSDQNATDAVAEFLATRPLLLVVDNCEHLLAATAGLADTLLRSAPALTILATSREPLRVPGEIVFRVPSLAIPDPDLARDPRQLRDYEAVRLFVARAGAAAPGFELDNENAADVARICFRLDGVPLALELAAGRIGALVPAAIADRLDDRFRLLRSRSHASPTRQQTLTATLQWSHNLLAADERILFRRLAIFTGGFELEAIERVCAGGELDPAGIADVLGRLVEKSLVAADDQSSRRRRYRLLETVRLYARHRLEEEGETMALGERHARWALSLASELRGSPQLDRDGANLRSALELLLQRSPSDALHLCIALLPFWMRRIDLREAQRRFDEALHAAGDRSLLHARALLAAAAIDLRSGAIARCLARAEESHDVASELGDASAQWRAQQFLGEAALANDAADVAMQWLERALRLAQQEGFSAGHAIGVYSLGVAHWMLGDLARADELVAHSVGLFDGLADRRERIPSPVNFAETSRPGRRRGLRVVFEDTLQPFVEISCDAAAGYVLANQAGIARARGEPKRARRLLDEAAARFEASADEAGTAAILVRRAYLDLAEGALPAARRCLELALALRRAQGDRRGMGLVLAGIGLIDTTSGDHDTADRHLAEARDIFRRAGDRWALAATLWRTADLALACGDVDDAEAALREALSVLQPTQRERWIANTLAGLAEVAWLRGDTEQAIALLGDARQRYGETHDSLGAADVERRLREIAKSALSPVKEQAPRTPSRPNTKGRRR